MLTEDEKKWLERREDRHSATGYYISLWDFPGKSLFGMAERPNYKDAAEFESRVAEKLATVICAGCEDFNKKNVCPLAIYQASGIYECRMKHARLAVEREMIAEGKEPVE